MSITFHTKLKFENEHCHIANAHTPTHNLMELALLIFFFYEYCLKQ